MMMSEKHCETCICGRRAPVQETRAPRGPTSVEILPEHVKGAGTVSWQEYLLAYADYASRYGRDQSAERLAERGGFSYWELCSHLGRQPTTWEPRR